jgi:hypothetical protein
MTMETGAIYDFPDDEEASLEALLSALPERHRLRLTGLPFGGFRLRLPSAGAQAMLMLAVDGLGHPASHSVLHDGELFIPKAERAATEVAINAHCSGPVMWSELHCVRGHPDAMRGFDKLWARDVFPKL